MRPLIAAVFGLLCFCGCESAIGTSLSALDPCISGRLTFGLIGQSNMSGSNTDPAPPIANSARIDAFGNDWEMHSPATEPLDSGIGQIDPISFDATPGIGPGRYFADAILDALPTSNITLVIGSRYSTGARAWQPIPDGGTRTTRHTRLALYGSELDRLAVASLRGGPIAGIFLVGGERDATVQADADLWAERTTETFEAYRDDIGDPNLVIVYAQIRPRISGTAHPAWQTVRAEQATLQSPINVMVPVPDTGTALHLTAAEQAVFGRLAGEAWVQAAGCP